MVKSSLGLKLLELALVMVSLVTMAPSLPIFSPQSEFTEDYSSIRMERSANLSHITGTGRKIRMIIRNKYLQIFADGTVNGTDEENDYTILQRTSVNAGQVKIQGVATCAFLCMDSCGLLYSTREFDDECVFHETIEPHSYNTYSSAKYSNDKRIYYIGLTKRGTARKVQIKTGTALGKLSAYTKVLPQPVEPHIVANLLQKMQALHQAPQQPMRHHQVCPPPHHKKIHESPKCKKKHRKKKKRKCEDNECTVKGDEKAAKKKCEDTEECHKYAKKRKSEGQSKSKNSAEKNDEEEESMTTVVPGEGAEDEFLNNDNN